MDRRPARRTWVLASVVLALAAILIVVIVRVGGARRAEIPPAPVDHTATAQGPQHDPQPRVPVATTTLDPSPVEHAPTPDGADGYEVRGTVRARAGGAIADARIRVALAIGDGSTGNTRAVGEAACARDGSYRVVLPDLAALEETLRGLARLTIEASAPGFQDARETRRAPARSADRPDAPVAKSIPCDFLLLEGDRVRGRIVDAIGHPVAGAEVELWVAGTRGKLPKALPCAQTTSDHEGRFVLGFTSSTDYALSARKDGSGTAFVEALALEAHSDRDVGDVVLVGRGELAGRMLYPDRTPVREFELWAVPEALMDESNALAAAVRRGALSEGADGTYYARATTGADGGFKFAGLAPGRYALRSPNPTAVIEPHQGRYALDNRAIALELQSHRLLVRATNRFGVPLPGATASCAHMTTLSDGTLEPASTEHETLKGPDAVATFDVEPDTPLGVVVQAPGCLPAEEVVLLENGQHELERVFVLEPVGPTGRLRLVLPRLASGTTARAEASLASAATERPLVGIGVLEPDAQGWLPPLAPGRYWIDVGFPSSAVEPSYFFPWRSHEPVTIEPGFDRQLLVEPRVGARLDLSLRVIGAPPKEFADDERELDRRGHDAARDEVFAMHHGARVGAVQSATAAAQVTSELPLQFQVAAPDDAGTHELSSLLLPGSHAVTESLFELGEWTLRIHAPGFRPVEKTVRLDRAGITAIEIEIEAE